MVSPRSTEHAGPTDLPVSRLRPAYQQVADQLRELILNGSLAAGDRLPNEADMSTNFGVSRSTIREALRVLASQGLITTLRGTTGGTFVARVDPGQVSQFLETSLGLMSGGDTVSLDEMLEAREVLEIPATRLAAVRRTEEHLDALRAAFDREVQTRGGRGVKFQEHRNFHAVIVDAAANSLLAVMTEPVFRVLQGRFLNPEVPGEFWTQVDRDHEEIMSCIAAGDPDAAERAMRDHLLRLRPTYGPVMRKTSDVST